MKLSLIFEELLTEAQGRAFMRKIVKVLEKQNWVVERTRSNHWKFIPPDPNMSIVIASGTPSDKRAIRNMIGELRRNGAIIDNNF